MEQENPSMEVLEVCKIAPSPSPPNDFSLPLTFLDIVYFLCFPAKRLLFFSFPSNDELPHNFDSILQNLKHSLSLTLSHFLPLAGNLVWPNHSQHPFILYEPGDSVSLTIAKTNANFNHLSSNHLRKAKESRFFVPRLPQSQTSVPAMSLQITLFPESGFSIGIATNHVVADGKTSTMFLKSWASISKTNNNYIPTPIYDRTAITNDPINGLQSLYNKHFGTFVKNPKNLISPPSKMVFSDDLVRGTFELTRTDIENLRRKVNEVCSSIPHLSTFVLTFAYVSTCLVKSQRMEGESKIILSFIVDWRPRVGTLGGVDYFGNGVSGKAVFFEVKEFEEENAVAMVSMKIGEEIRKITEHVNENNFVEMVEEIAMGWEKEKPIAETIVVMGSPRFGIYDIDFGWGSCKKVEVSVGPGCFSVTDSKNGNGGVELGIVLPENVMSVFSSLFSEGLK